MAFKLKGLSPLPSYTLFLAFMKVSFPCLFCKNPNGFQVERVIPSPVIHTIPGFHESVISMFYFCIKLHNFTPLKPKMLLGKTPRPPPPPTVTSLTHFTKLKQSSRMCFAWRKYSGMSYLYKLLSVNLFQWQK